ncbi:MAG TPA: UDP-N-acetylmuramoylalanyl-D-glutamyl-2, 6-diaminopimelate--D-alanyl-D-alanine ligase [Acidimicrobiaceae bacterium]|jgi:UDP-N-acetylmuramoyl-tripeptide--D-alanyl-D-alanine ligase|nr:UDP-N-acetylmuramoylalanyl-D-glutamyl-2, 6-diaminopimelate--D-alanyl-D-alanine ligase [Acidimicrobiaceae bacterium]
MQFTLPELLLATTGQLHPPENPAAQPGSSTLNASGAESDAMVTSVTIDSRALVPGSLFVAIQGERDGHDFLELAAGQGASAALVSRLRPEVELTQILVPDTEKGLADIGRAARSRMSVPVIGITGSVGKTSTKDLLAAIAAHSGPVAASEKSLNNELGVPLTLANALAEAERVIIEMGARGVGHIRYLCEIAEPTIGIVTRVALAHTEMFGSLEATAEAKSELVQSLPSSGTAVLNAEDPLVAAMADRTDATVITYGSTGEVVAEAVALDDRLFPSFRLISPWGNASVRLGVRGVHNVSNALAAATAALASGVHLDHVVQGLSESTLSPLRMELLKSPYGGGILNDSYNANPASMRAALEALASLRGDRRVAVLGVMAELGEQGPAEHQAIAGLARRLGIELIAFGTDLYGTQGLSSIDEVLALQSAPGEGEQFLVKGSRIAALERLVEAWMSQTQG